MTSRLQAGRRLGKRQRFLTSNLKGFGPIPKFLSGGHPSPLTFDLSSSIFSATKARSPEVLHFEECEELSLFLPQPRFQKEGPPP